MKYMAIDKPESPFRSSVDSFLFFRTIITTNLVSGKKKKKKRSRQHILTIPYFALFLGLESHECFAFGYIPLLVHSTTYNVIRRWRGLRLSSRTPRRGLAKGIHERLNHHDVIVVTLWIRRLQAKYILMGHERLVR